MGVYYDHLNRRAFITEVRQDPKTGAIERFITGEVPYTGESPLASPAQESGPTLSPQQADALQQDLQGFLLHSPESPLDAITREQLARRVAWQREHGGNR